MTYRATTNLAWLTLLAVTGCRGEAERRAAAQVAGAESAARGIPGLVAEGRPSDVRLRRLWVGEAFNFYASSPSPDGRYVTEIDWATGDLAVRDLTDGRLHHLTDKGDWTSSGDYALSSTFSPAGEQVAYVWWNGDAQRHDLRAVRFTVDGSGTPQGSNPRVVHSSPGLQPYSLFGWTADGRILATLRRPDRTSALALVAAEDGRTTILESFDWRLPHAARSPDGQYIAYDFPPDGDLPERDIYLLSVDGARKVPIVEEAGDDAVLAWLPDDSGLLFASRHADRTSIRKLPIAGGSPAGAAQPVHEDIPGRVEPLGFTSDALVFGVTVESTKFHVARIDRSRRQLASTKPFADPYGGSVRAWDWSPDGSHFVHDTRGAPGSPDFRLVLRSADGNPVRSFHLDGRAETVRWAPDGRTVFLYAYDRAGRPGLRALELESGEMRTIRLFHAEWESMGGRFAVSPDGKRLGYRVLKPGSPVTIPTHGSIVLLDLETGVERASHAVRAGGSLTFSPDGEWLGFVDYDARAGRYALRVIPATGGDAREVFRQSEGQIIEGLNWTPDASRFVFLGGSPGDHALLEVPAAGGDPAVLAEVPWLAHAEPRLHPDGRTIAFRAGRQRGEIWALDGIASTGGQPARKEVER